VPVDKGQRPFRGVFPGTERNPVANKDPSKRRVRLLVPAKPATKTSSRNTDHPPERSLRAGLLNGAPQEPAPLAGVLPDPGHVHPREPLHKANAGCYDVTTLSSAKAESGTSVSDTSGEVAKQRVPEYEDIVRRVGKRLNTRRDEAGISLRELERQTGISVATISRIENGLQREMSAGTFFKLCETLKMDPLVALVRRQPQARPEDRQRRAPVLPAHRSRSIWEIVSRRAHLRARR
jgi:transcriptional regulator with XRE-family HTH domain